MPSYQYNGEDSIFSKTTMSIGKLQKKNPVYTYICQYITTEYALIEN